MSESDGWVDAGRDIVIIVSSPNDKLFDKLFTTLGVSHRFQKQPPITRIQFGTEDGLSLPVFNPRIHSNNYDNLVTMATAKAFPDRISLPESFISQIRPILMRTELNHNEICLHIAQSTGHKICSASVKKYQNLELQRTIPPLPSFLSRRLLEVVP